MGFTPEQYRIIRAHLNQGYVSQAKLDVLKDLLGDCDASMAIIGFHEANLAANAQTHQQQQSLGPVNGKVSKKTTTKAKKEEAPSNPLVCSTCKHDPERDSNHSIRYCPHMKCTVRGCNAFRNEIVEKAHGPARMHGPEANCPVGQKAGARTRKALSSSSSSSGGEVQFPPQQDAPEEMLMAHAPPVHHHQQQQQQQQEPMSPDSEVRSLPMLSHYGVPAANYDDDCDGKNGFDVVVTRCKKHVASVNMGYHDMPNAKHMRLLHVKEDNGQRLRCVKVTSRTPVPMNATNAKATLDRIVQHEAQKLHSAACVKTSKWMVGEFDGGDSELFKIEKQVYVALGRCLRCHVYHGHTEDCLNRHMKL